MSGTCIFSVELLGESGTQYQTEAVSKIGSPGAAVEYALPRSRVYYTEQKTGWKVDCGISGGDTVLLEIFSDKAMTQRVAKVARHVPGKSMFTFVWKGWFGKKRAEAGKYWCRVMLKDQPETAKIFTLEVEEGPEPVEPLRITGQLLPETDDPDELLELLCAPLDCGGHRRDGASKDLCRARRTRRRTGTRTRAVAGALRAGDRGKIYEGWCVAA